MTETEEILANVGRLQRLAECYYDWGNDTEHRKLILLKGGNVPASEYSESLVAYDGTTPGNLWRPVRELSLLVASDYVSKEVDHSAVRDVVNADVAIKRAMCQVGDEQCWLISKPADQILLTNLLAIVSMIDELAGWGPTFDYQLANLHMQAQEANLDFEKAVQIVADISSKRCRSGRNGTSIREFLMTFDLGE